MYCSDKCRGRVARRRRRAREFNAPGDLHWIEVIRLWMADHRRCAYCRVAIDGQPEPDHVIPLSRGGRNDVSNVLPACARCNASKCDMTPPEWCESLAARGLEPIRFDPAAWTHLVMRPATGRPHRWSA